MEAVDPTVFRLAIFVLAIMINHIHREHASLDTGHGRSLQIEFGGVHYGALTEVCV